MTDYATQVKERITMPDLLERYGIARSDEVRIPCPIHSGKDRNFAVKRNWFHCYVCGAEGSVIDFAMLYFGLDFTGALIRLNDDFGLGLPIGCVLSQEEKAEAARKAYRLRQERDRKKRERQAVQDRYQDALDRWISLDTMKRNNAPQGNTEQISDAYVAACREIDAAAYELEQAENALYALRHSERG